MGAVTYPDPKVEQYLMKHFVPLQFNVVEHPEVMAEYNSAWTPTIIVQDPEGREHRRSQGYLDAGRFLGELALARLKDAVDRREFPAAKDRLADAMEYTKGDPEREPEALYWAAVVNYKNSSDASGLMAGWNTLLDRFPKSEWAKKAGFIRD